jgi:hypothetical protein
VLLVFHDDPRVRAPGTILASTVLLGSNSCDLFPIGVDEKVASDVALDLDKLHYYECRITRFHKKCFELLLILIVSYHKDPLTSHQLSGLVDARTRCIILVQYVTFY